MKTINSKDKLINISDYLQNRIAQLEQELDKTTRDVKLWRDIAVSNNQKLKELEGAQHENTLETTAKL